MKTTNTLFQIVFCLIFLAAIFNIKLATDNKQTVVTTVTESDSFIDQLILMTAYRAGWEKGAEFAKNEC